MNIVDLIDNYLAKQTKQRVIIAIGDKQWTGYVYSNASDLAEGMANRDSIPKNFGILFDLKYPQILSVTTEKMKFNLDIAFCNDKLKIIEIRRNVPPRGIYSSSFPARYFLEVSAGELNTIKPNSEVEIYESS